MADPGKPSEFSSAESAASEFAPAELDLLEDALERWTGPMAGDLEAVPEDSSLTPKLRARLEDYRSLLTLTRAELPDEDVPDTLLAGVLAEAHAGARPTTTRPVTRRELVAAGPSLWERLRRSMLLPGVALAGSAALLLWVVQPAEPGDMLASAERSETTAQTPARLATPASPAPAAAEAPKLERGPVEVDGMREALEEKDAEPAPSPGAAPPSSPSAPADALEEVARDDSAGAKYDRKVKSKKSASQGPPIEAYPGLDDALPAEDTADKETLRNALEQADAVRHKSGCIQALPLYRDALTMGGADSERAKVFAGYGLCLAEKGDDTGADKYFEAARKKWPAVDSWIQRERGDGPSRKSPAKPSSRAKQDMPFD